MMMSLYLVKSSAMFFFLLEVSWLLNLHTFSTFSHPWCFHFEKKVTRIYEKGV